MRYVCPECQKFALRTMEGALICPDGHGKVLGVCSLTEYSQAQRTAQKISWLLPIPSAQKQKRGYTIDGIPGVYKRACVPHHGKTTSKLTVGQMAPPGYIAAKVGERAYIFQPVKDRIGKS